MTYTVIKDEVVGNKELLVAELDGLYNIFAYVDGKCVGDYFTRDKEEAIEVYQENLWEMSR